MFYLPCSGETLEARLKQRGEPEKLAYALSRLELIGELPFPTIDTADRQPDEVVEHIIRHLGLETGA